MNLAAQLELHVHRELAAWKVLDPHGGALRARLLAASRESFSRTALALVAAWLGEHAGCAETWVWSIGDAHHQHFTTLATGRLRRDGLPAVGYGVNAFDQQHPAPWPWDLLRLAASVAASRRLSPAELGNLAAALLAEYLRSWGRIADDDAEAALRIDLNGLPEALKRRVEADSEPAAYAAHLNRHCRGLRLRRGTAAVDDPLGAAELGRRLAHALSLLPTGGHELIDLVRLTGQDERSGEALGWLGLLRERDRSQEWRLRLITLRPRQPQVLPRMLPALAISPRPALPAPALAPGDPYQVTLPDPVHPYLVRTWCHGRHPLALGALDGGDLRRLAQLWGQQLAGFHAAGLARLGYEPAVRARNIAAEAQRRARELPALALALARFTASAHARFAAGQAHGRSARRG